MSEARKHSKHFFARDGEGRVTVRIRFDSDEASLYEEAAGSTPIMIWIHRTLTDAAKKQVTAARKKRANIPPPE